MDLGILLDPRFPFEDIIYYFLGLFRDWSVLAGTNRTIYVILLIPTQPTLYNHGVELGIYPLIEADTDDE